MFSNNEFHLDGKVIPVAHGEAIVFEIPLGICKLVVIANIPEDSDKSVVYIKVRASNERRPDRKPRPPRRTEGTG